jgi:hypothetical protein
VHPDGQFDSLSFKKTHRYSDSSKMVNEEDAFSMALLRKQEANTKIAPVEGAQPGADP